MDIDRFKYLQQLWLHFLKDSLTPKLSGNETVICKWVEYRQLQMLKVLEAYLSLVPLK